MAYLEIHQSLRDHRKTLALAAELDMPEPHVAGHCLFLWLWCIDNAEDGALPKSLRIIERAAAWQGLSGAFVAALEAVGMIDRDEDDRLHIHDWMDYAGRLIERRRENAERMRDARANRQDSRTEPRAQHVQRTFAARAGAREEKRREEKSTVEDLTVPSLSASDHFLTSKKGDGGDEKTADAENTENAENAAVPDIAFQRFVRDVLASFNITTLTQETMKTWGDGLHEYYCRSPDRTRGEAVKAAEWLSSANNKKHKRLSIGFLRDWLDRAFSPPPQPPSPTDRTEADNGTDRRDAEARAARARAQQDASIARSGDRLERISALVSQYGSRAVS